MVNKVGERRFIIGSIRERGDGTKWIIHGSEEKIHN